MLKKLFSFVILFVLIAPVSFSQDVQRTGGYARVQSMGNNPYLIDPDAMKYNPAWSSIYYNFIWGDIGSNAGVPFGNSSSGQFLGVNFKLDRNFTLGAMLSRNDLNTFFSISDLDPAASFGTGFSALGSVPGTVQLNNNLEVFASLKAGSTSFGLGIAYAGSKNNTTQANGAQTEISASQFGINAGFLTNVTRGFLIDGALSFILPGASSEPSTGSKIDASQTIIAANLRLFIKADSRFRVIPTLNFVSSNGSVEAAGVSGDLNSLTTFGGGVGIEYSIGDFLFVGGPGFNSVSATIPSVPGASPELKNSAFYFPVWNLGAEWTALNWLVARMGYTASTGNVTNQTAQGQTQFSENTTTLYSPGTFTLGVGLRFDSFSIDATINHDVLRQGLGNIGGGPTFAYISSSYAF